MPTTRQWKIQNSMFRTPVKTWFESSRVNLCRDGLRGNKNCLTWSAKIYKVDTLNSAKLINFARHQHDTEKTPKQGGLVAHQYGVRDRFSVCYAALMSLKNGETAFYGYNPALCVVLMSCWVNFQVVRSALLGVVASVCILPPTRAQ